MRAIKTLPAILLLTACGPVSPTWMPAGYSWHNDTYKAQPGPESENLGYAYSPARNDYMVMMWAGVARSLVDDLENKTGMSQQAVYLEKLPETNAFNLSLDHALREELRARGYTLVNSPAESLHVKYQAFKPEDEKERIEIPYNGDLEEQRKPWNPEQTEEYTFVMTLLRDGAAFGETRSNHALPGYGYVAGEGNILPALHVMDGKPEQPAAPPVKSDEGLNR
ncbi:MAG: hypothetical protein WBK77_03815 [Alphaproteobacteria bacterium]